MLKSLQGIGSIVHPTTLGLWNQRIQSFLKMTWSVGVINFRTFLLKGITIKLNLLGLKFLDNDLINNNNVIIIYYHVIWMLWLFLYSFSIFIHLDFKPKFTQYSLSLSLGLPFYTSSFSSFLLFLLTIAHISYSYDLHDSCFNYK